jgi:hypothetical protein
MTNDDQSNFAAATATSTLTVEYACRPFIIVGLLMLFMSPDIGMTEPLALPCTISATGDDDA